MRQRSLRPVDLRRRADKPADGFVPVNHFTHKTLAGNGTSAATKRPVKGAPAWTFTNPPDGTCKIGQVGRALTAAADASLTTAEYKATVDQKWRQLPRPIKFTG